MTARRHHIGAVVVCVNYSDFLSHTLPAMKATFDELVVVTSPDDRETVALCESAGVRRVETTAFFSDGHRFNKGRGINAGLDALRQDGWMAQVDSDIILPSDARDIWDALPLDRDTLYGVDRLMCPTYDAWLQACGCPLIARKDDLLVTRADLFRCDVRMGARAAGGYVPMGYFQLWHGSTRRRYPTQHDSAATSDVLFAAQWPRPRRQLLPEIVAVHLTTDARLDARRGANWQGRTTARFGVPVQS